MITRPILALAAVITLCSGCAFGASRVVTIDATADQTPISPYVYGQFIEHLGRCIYGGIWAEMLEDRKFFYPVDGKQSGWGEHQGKEVSWEGEGIPYEILTASPWQIIGPADAVSMNTIEPLAGDQDVRIDLAADEARGIEHPRLALETGREYTGYIVARNEGATIRVEVALLTKAGAEAEVVATFDTIGESFTKLPFKFTATANANDARLAIRATGEGQLYIGTVSLMPADNVDGFRADTLALLRELNSPIYRWPGGNFVSGYDWRDGIGDRDRRPPRKNPAWTGVEHNDVGIHEFMRFCELIDTEPYIALNTGLGDVTSAAQEVEYIVGAPDTTEGAKRAANGRTEPWPATWWAVGNEMYGDWQLGHMPLEEYVKKHNAVVDAIRAVSPEAQCIGVGSAGKWSETMLTESADHMKLLSEHLYWQHREDVTDHVDVAVDQIEKLAATHRDYRRSIEGLEEKDIRIALDEWNFWYGPYLYGELGTRYFHRDGLGCAAALHAMFRNSDLFVMANYAQTVNVIGAIKTTRTDAWLETTGQVLKLYRQHFGTQPVPVTEDMTGVDVVAAWSEDRSVLTIAAVNTRAKAVTIQLEATGVDLPEEAGGWTIQHDDPEAYNDEDNPGRIAAQPATVSLAGGQLELAPYSITLIQIPAKGPSAEK